jgi:hypothetical protein
MRNIIVNAAPYALGAPSRTAASRPLAGFGLRDRNTDDTRPVRERHRALFDHRHANLRTASMSPKSNKNNNIGGTRGRAALTLSGDAARAGERQVLAHSFAMLAVTITLLVISAPSHWPQLFAG